MAPAGRQLDPRTRILAWLGALAACVAVPGGWPLLPCLLLALALAAGVGAGAAVARFTGVLILPTAAMLLVVYGLLVPPPPGEVPLRALGAAWSPVGLRYAFDVAGRLLTIGTATLAFSRATPPTDLARGLRRFGLPAPLAGLFVSSFSLAGVARRRAHQIMEAQRSRGLWPHGLLIGRLRVLVPVLRPLLFGLLLGALERSALWESRGYLRLSPGGPARHPWYDAAVLSLALLLLLCAVASRWLV